MSVDPVAWRENWLMALLCLADYELQRERWLNKNITNPAWSYVEFMCDYFDDVLVGEDYEFFFKEKLVRVTEYECIKSFHTELSRYKPPNGNDYDPEVILKDKKWQAITDLGKSSLKKLEAILISSSEKEIFEKRLHAAALTTGDFTWGLPDTKH